MGHQRTDRAPEGTDLPSAPPRNMALSLENEFPVGLKSGLQGGEHELGANTFDGTTNLGCLVCREVVHDDGIFDLRVRTSTGSPWVGKTLPFLAAS